MVYLDEPQLIEMLAGIHRLLRPGGAFIVSDPNGGKWMNHLERPIKPLFGLPSAMYTEAETIRLLRSVGFARCRRRRDLAGSWRYLTMAAYKAADAARPLNGARRPEIGAAAVGAPAVGASPIGAAEISTAETGAAGATTEGPRVA